MEEINTISKYFIIPKKENKRKIHHDEASDSKRLKTENTTQKQNTGKIN